MCSASPSAGESTASATASTTATAANRAIASARPRPQRRVAPADADERHERHADVAAEQREDQIQRVRGEQAVRRGALAEHDADDEPEQPAQRRPQQEARRDHRGLPRRVPALREQRLARAVATDV